MWKWLAGILLVLGVLGGGSAAVVFGMGGPDELVKRLRPEPQPLKVRTEPVSLGDLVRTINAPGDVEPRTVVKVSAQVSARIVDLPFREGDTVRTGDVLVRLDDKDVRARLEAARSRLRAEEAALDGARASLRLAEIEYARLRELHDTRDVSRSALDTGEADYERARASVRSIESGIDAARAEIVEREKDVENTVVASPMNGQIVTLSAEVGELVLGTRDNLGTVIMIISDLHDMILRARIDETNVGPVRTGQKARIYLNAYPDRVFDGVVDRVKLRREVARDGTNYVEAEVRVLLDDGELLKSGLTGNVDIEVETQSGVIKVPSQAVLDRRVEDLPAEVRSAPALDRDKVFAHVAYRIVDGKAVATPVRIGTSDLTHTVVREGLGEGDRIVVGPYKVLLTLEHNKAVHEETAGADGTAEPAGDAGGDPGSSTAEGG
jgi:HlyD family secretion protein